jgi:hypothetical protein
VIYPPGLTRGIQVGLGVFVVLIAVVGYRGYLRRHGPPPPIPRRSYRAGLRQLSEPNGQEEAE